MAKKKPPPKEAKKAKPTVDEEPDDCDGEVAPEEGGEEGQKSEDVPKKKRLSAKERRALKDAEKQVLLHISPSRSSTFTSSIYIWSTLISEAEWEKDNEISDALAGVRSFFLWLLSTVIVRDDPL